MVFRVPRDGVNLLGWISVKWRNISFFFFYIFKRVVQSF